MRKMKARRIGIIAVLSLLFIPGCKPPEVRITIGPEFANSAIQIDFVRVPRKDVPSWMSLDVDAYFTPGNPLRAEALEKGMIFSVYYGVPNKPFISRVEEDDPVWNQFDFNRGSTAQDFDIIILADLPGVHGTGEQEIRREKIPLYAKAWPSTLWDRLLLRGRIDSLAIEFTADGIRMDPAPQHQR